MFQRNLWTSINETCIILMSFVIVPEFPKYKNDFLKCINGFLDFKFVYYRIYFI